MNTSWNRIVESPVVKQQNEKDKVISEERQPSPLWVFGYSLLTLCIHYPVKQNI
jgi:hypothetical protein